MKEHWVAYYAPSLCWLVRSLIYSGKEVSLRNP